MLKSDKQLIQLDEDYYEGDKDMEYILRKLTSATVDAELRKDMDVEDEYYSVLESRDTTIMNMDKRIKQQMTQLDEQKSQLDEQKSQLDEQKSQLDEQRQQLANFARVMARNGMSEEQIAEATGMELSVIHSLLNG